jgi:hypothetical protein
VTSHATPASPAPQGPRYQQHRPWTGRLLAVAFTVLVVALVAALLQSLWSRYDGQTVTGKTLGFTVWSDTSVTIRVEASKRPGSRAYCNVRSRDISGAEVGRDVLVVDPVGTRARSARGELVLRTTRRAVTGEVQGCSPEPISKDPDHVQDAYHP